MRQFAVLSVDFELFEHTYAYQRLKENPRLNVREDLGVKRILSLFDEKHANSTFFTVGAVVEKYAELVETIACKGHEVASHTLSHVSFNNLGNERIKIEIVESKKLLEQTINERVVGFRAPAFEINPNAIEFVVRILENLGYRYDSSIVPSFKIPLWYGLPSASIYPTRISKIFTEIKSQIIEFPIAINPLIRMPISGSWMRIFGVHYTLLGIRALLKRKAIPILYVHAWELVDLPEIDGIPRRVYFRTGDRASEMIKHILENVDVKFVSIRDLLDVTGLEEC